MEDSNNQEAITPAERDSAQTGEQTDKNRPETKFKKRRRRRPAAKKKPAQALTTDVSATNALPEHNDIAESLTAGETSTSGTSEGEAIGEGTVLPKSGKRRRRRRKKSRLPGQGSDAAGGQEAAEGRDKHKKPERDLTKRILINARYPEEKRVAILEGDILSDFYVEVSSREHLKGNIYKGVIVSLMPGLQAAFVDFGQKKHGFIQMREVMPYIYKDKSEGKRVQIQDVLAKGQEIIVQVEKDERDTKGASLTTYISIPGRYIVMMPGQQRVGISRKIENQEDRDRLKETFNTLKLPKDTGFILRTACGDTSVTELDQDLKYLTKLWTRIQADAKKVKAPALIYKEHDIAVRTVRDYLTSDVAEVFIDTAETFSNTKAFLRKTTPWLKINITQYKDKKPIFSQYNLEAQIAKLNERHVNLPSRGYLVVDKTEALTAIDVNSGRSKKEENVESTALRTNMEAAVEIARQLRLRDIGGLIVIDFIDMDLPKNRKQVEQKMKEALATDKANTEISGISRFGMLEMTRERMRTAYFDSVNTQCGVCAGNGIIKSNEFTALSAMRELHNKAAGGDVSVLTCRLPIESANYLTNTQRDDISGLEKAYGIKIAVIADPAMPAGRYSIEAGNE
jgi:ribonuclease E